MRAAPSVHGYAPDQHALPAGPLVATVTKRP
jgi:hypothetical protein